LNPIKFQSSRIGLKSFPGHEKLLAQEALFASDIKRGLPIPQITIKTGLKTPDGHDELLTEYLCDQPGCPNIATHVLGCMMEVGATAAVCDEHAPEPRS
jgi:hypothetical protein